MRILIPVNGTPGCEMAIPLAQQLADEVDADICRRIGLSLDRR